MRLNFGEQFSTIITAENTLKREIGERGVKETLKSYAVPATVSRPEFISGVHSSKTTVCLGGWEGSTNDKPGDLPDSPHKIIKLSG